MDHIKILKRAFHIIKVYRALWLFGIFLALTTGINPAGSASGGGGGGGGGGSGNGSFIPPQNPVFPWNGPEFASALITIGIALICIFFLIALVLVVARYVTETAVISMVNRYEETEQQVGIREGFRLGWSRPAWRMFLIDLVVGLGTFAVVILLMLIAAAPLLLWFTGNDNLGYIGTFGTIGLGIIFIFLIIAWAIVLSVLSQFFRRATVLEDLGVFASIQRGWQVARGRLGDTVVMALILFGLGLGWLVLMIPIYILLGFAGVLLGGLPGLAAGFLTSLVSGGALPWVIGGLVGISIFLLVFALPALFLNGLFKVFVSSSWTLTYREMVALEDGSDRAVIVPDEPEPPVPAIPPEVPESPEPAEPPEAPEMPEVASPELPPEEIGPEEDQANMVNPARISEVAEVPLPLLI